ncbi:MAG: ECF transporter S component [Eubacteriales bacterium]
MNSNVAISKRVNVTKMAQIGMLAAIAVVLMLFEIPMPFAPGFYKLDLSEVPVLIGCFALGPLAGAIIELIKILLNFIIDGSVTAGVGEMANLIIGCSFCIPAGIIYRRHKTKKMALIGMIVGTLFMTVVGCFLNAYVLLPAYAAAFQMPIEALVEMGTVLNGNITNLFTFVVFAVAPFNLLKGVVVSAVVFVSYKRVKVGTKMM